jgi:hypothetical protein
VEISFVVISRVQLIARFGDHAPEFSFSVIGVFDISFRVRLHWHDTPAYMRNFSYINYMGFDRLCGLVVKVLGYRSGGPGSIPGTTRKKKVVGLERGPLSIVSTTEELLDRKVAAPV